ncbi:CD226 antigen isoform 2-T2 [Synchiropus picturatus]
MEVVQKDPWYFMVLIVLSVLKGSSSSGKENTVVRLEEGMVLDCTCPWKGNLTMVIWNKEPKEAIAVYHPEFGASLKGHYKDRVTFLRTTLMDGSISLTNVTHRDIGSYMCSIQTFPNGPWRKTIEVEDLDEPPEVDDEDGDNDVEEVREEKQEQATEWPGAEEAQEDVEMEAELGGNLTLQCDQQHNHSISQVVLERKLSRQWKIIGVCKRVDDRMLTEDYSERGQVVCTQHLDVRLHLTGVASEDGGFYRCISSTAAGLKSTTFHVTVATAGGFSLKLYLMYVYIGVGVAALVLLNVIIILTIRHKKKNRREEYRVKEHPFQKQPNLYENFMIVPPAPRTSKHSKKSPIYANIKTVRASK